MKKKLTASHGDLKLFGKESIDEKEMVKIDQEYQNCIDHEIDVDEDYEMNEHNFD